jgi:ligand-binding SRPBCC domain-containing protein
MVVTACPAATVAAPPSAVWELVATPEGLESWVDARVLRAEPPGPLRAGQRLRLETRFLGLGVGLTMDARDVDPERRRLHVLVGLPFGVVNDETITMAETAAGTLVRFG